MNLARLRSQMGNRITLLVMQSGASRPKALLLPIVLIYGFLAAAVGVISLLVFLSFWSRGIWLEAREARTLRAEVMRLGQENVKLRLLESDLQEIANVQDRVLDWAGLASVRQRADASLRAGFGDSLVGEGAQPAVVSAGLVETLSTPGGPLSVREGWRWPIRGWISRGFGRGQGSPEIHFGIDIVGPRETLVVAAAAGTVSYAGWDDELGNMVVIQHPDGISTTYGHNSALQASAGDDVTGGRPIARLGSTGRSSAPHLHFEVRVDGSPVDPEEFLDGQ